MTLDYADRSERDTSVSLLVSGGCVVTMDEERHVYLDGAVAVDGSSIVAVGRREDIAARYTSPKVIDARGCIVLPGFVNAHTHGFQTLYRGLGDDLDMFEWVERVIHPLSRHLRAPEAATGTALACLEMIKSGVTCFADSFYVHHDLEAVDHVAETIVKSGLRGTLARASSDTGNQPPELLETVQRATEETERAIKTWDGTGDGRLSVCPEALFTLSCTPELITSLRGISLERGTGFHMHAGESIDEAKEIRRRTGKSIFSYLDSVDALGPGALIHHAIWCTDRDIEILAERQTAISHNPVSNQYLAVGIAPVARMLERGVLVALGTDGAASNNSQNYLETIKAAVLLQKVGQLDPLALTAERALEMATINGAVALGLADRVGSLEPSKRADLAMVRLRSPNGVPIHKPVSCVVYSASASDVDTVVVDGRVLMEARKVVSMDEDEVLERAQEVGASLVRASHTEGLLRTGRFVYVQ